MTAIDGASVSPSASQHARLQDANAGLRASHTRAKSRALGIKSLTGIRGVAAIWVLSTHFQAVLATYLRSPAINDSTLLYNGFRGVDLFFVLSGFILMHVHGNEFRTLETTQLRRFYQLRFFRVYPLNTAILLSLVPVALFMPGLVTWFRMDHGVPIPYHSRDFSLAGFVSSLLLAQTWTVVKLGEWNGPAWSLSAEVFGYAFFPLLACLLIRRRSPMACTMYAIASLTTLCVLLFVSGHARDCPTGSFGLIRMVFSFVAGASMARCFQLLPTGWKPSRAMAWISLLVIAAALSVPWANFLVVFGFCGLIFSLAFQQGVIDWWLSSAPAMFLGRISFSLYLIHYVPLKISLWLAQSRPEIIDVSLPVRILYLVAILTLCLLAAIITNRYLEVPFQRYARRSLSGSGASAAGQPAA